MIAFERHGSGERAILFIHGHPFNRSMWTPQIEALSNKYTIIAPDLRGYGESAPSRQDAVTLEEFAADLAAVLDKCSIRKACVVGLSMGGQIAMEFARAYRERVAGLVFAATFARAETPEGTALRHRTAEEILQRGMALHGCDLLPKLIGPTTMKARPRVASFVYEMIASTSPQGAAAALRGRAKRRDYTADLESFNVPAVIVVGTEDAFTDVSEAASMQTRMPRASLEVFEGIGHMPNLEDPDRFNELLQTFLQAVYVD